MYSAVKPQGYSGSAMQVQRASDSTTLDIGYTAQGLIDTAAINAFGAATTVGISILYDTSGSGNHATQATLANQPIVYSLNDWAGIPTFSMAGVFNTSAARYLTLPTSLALARTNHSVVMAVRPRLSWAKQTYWEFNSGVTLHSNVQQFGTASTRGLSVNGGSSANTQTFARARPGVIGICSGASNRNVWINGLKSAQTADTALTMNTGGSLGRTAVQGGNNNLYNGLFDLFACAFYSSALSDANYQAVEAAFNSTFSLPTSFTKKLVYGGSSLIQGVGSTLNQTMPFQTALPSEWEVINLGISGQSLGTEYTNRSVELNLFDSGKTKNVHAIDAPSNDIGAQVSFAADADAQTYADTLYTNTTLAFVTASKAAGFGVVVPTVIARGGFTSGNRLEVARLRYNSNVVAGAAANGYTLCDRAGEPLLGATGAAANTTYFNVDAIHCNNTGYALMAAIDRAAILAA